MKFSIKQTLPILLVLIAHAGICSGLFFEEYDWNLEPEFEIVSVNEQAESALFLKDFKAVEFFFDEEFNTLLQLYTVHCKVQVNTNEAIEMYNKHYMPMNRVLGIEDLRVRVVTDGGVREIEEIDLKDYEGEDRYSSYKYFAIDGVEIGSQIEYIYTFKMLPQLEGGREFFQTNELKLNTEFHLYCEDKMFFKTKSYNGFQDMELDTTISGKNHYYANVSKIEPLKPELYAPYRNSLMRVEYKLDHMKPADGVKLYTYDQLSLQLNNYLRSEISKKDIKALKSLSKELGIYDVPEMVKVRIIEDYIKRNITISEQNGSEMEDLGPILEKLVASQRGTIRLYVALFDLHEIKYKYGLTSDRTRVTMDPDFESYSFLENYIFYFPDTRQYMAPTEAFYRLGYIPFNWCNNYALMIESVTIGETVAGLGEMHFIEPLPYYLNEDRLDIQINFDGEFERLKLDIMRTLSGYNATYIQPIFELVPEEDTKAIVSELLNLTGRDAELVDYSLQNVSLDSFYLKPFIIQGSASTESSFFDKAGKHYLLKIGEVIGEQVEMYQEEERKLPVENEFNRNYERIIQFQIPEGYSVRNLDDLKTEFYHEEDGEKSMGFYSDYEVDGNRVTVHIKEFYKQLVYPLESFDQFRKIINAAADFNKKVLIFEKG